MKKVIPHITIENCKEVIEFYRDVFKGEIKNAKLADGIEMFKGHEGKYIHAELHIGDCALYFNDVFGDPPVKGNYIQLSLDLESEEEINRIYSALSEGGQVTMELQKTFWGALYAKVKDRHGIEWELNYYEQ
ncbi:VOC family protein [Weizmannia acidilactici]|uniref:VOC family protein n=1 Tax=Weizmannia acidilactici TaxID=2607726 RepID=A0A5J4JLK5_9BACI|nr:VOC family protein [Weizmannia acidilactici]GER67540.1 VOC family protein [Weizmannia acidilactici]GER71267.1 VOC family protein [Weizmannia acidilactici]GER74701.1 VOC family protein [Weizmannia acidilactici]